MPIEIELYISNLIINVLLRDGAFESAAFFASSILERVKGPTFNRRSLDSIAAKFYGSLSLSYEKVNRLENIRTTLLTLYRTSCLHRDVMSQVVLVNLILRNYLHYNLFEQASTFASKAPFPEDISNNQ